MKYIRMIYVALAITGITGCGGLLGPERELRNLVKERLKDPDSARFSELKISDDGLRACMSFNAKNSFGGYGNDQVATFRRSDGDKWNIANLDGGMFFCGDLEFTPQAEQMAIDGARSTASDMLWIGRKITKEEALELIDHGECSSAFAEYSRHKVDLAKGLNDEIKYPNDPELESQIAASYKRAKVFEEGFMRGKCSR